MRLSMNAPCPCGSGRKAKGCCGPVLDGAAAGTPEALMRSRYTAYATGAVAHLQRTTADDSPHRVQDARAWTDALRGYCDAVRFTGLEVRGASVDGDAGRVQFVAHLTHDGVPRVIAEDSRFVRVDGRWLYVDGTPLGDLE